MRRIVAVMTGALLLAFGAPQDVDATSTPDADGAVAVDADAFAAWVLLNNHGGGVFYFAEGVREGSVPFGVQSVAFVARGRCRTVSSKHFTFVVCEASARPHPVSLDQFSIDPLLRSAKLNVDVGGMSHRVEWVGKGSPGAGETAVAGPGWAVAGAGVSRWAKARATLFGRRLRSHGGFLAFLALSGLGYAAVYPGGSLEKRIRPDGTLLVRYRARLR